MKQFFCCHLKMILLLPTAAHVLLSSNTQFCIHFTLWPLRCTAESKHWHKPTYEWSCIHEKSIVKTDCKVNWSLVTITSLDAAEKNDWELVAFSDVFYMFVGGENNNLVVLPEKELCTLQRPAGRETDIPASPMIVFMIWLQMQP